MFKNPLLLIALTLTGAVAVWGIFDTPGLAQFASTIVGIQFTSRSWFIMLTASSLLITCLWLALSPEANESQESSEKFMLSSTMKISLRIILIVIPIFIGILALTLPDNLFMDPEIAERYDIDIELHTIYGYPIGRFLLNFILAPIFMAAIPFLFLYLAWKTFGVLRKSYLLNAIGFFLYYAGRILQGVFEVAGWPHLQATVPPLIILCSLLIIVIANNFEQLR